MGFKVSDVYGEYFQFGWVEIDKKNKKVKRTLTSSNWAVLELTQLEWAKPLFAKKLLPNFKQISPKENAIVPAQDLTSENRGKLVEVIWVEIDYLDHLVFHPEFTNYQMKLGLKALFELMLVLETNGWYIRYPHFGNITFAPEPMMFDIGDIRKNEDCQELPSNYTSIYSTLPEESMQNILGFDKLINHLKKFTPGRPSRNQKFIEAGLKIIEELEVKGSANYWDDYNNMSTIPAKNELEAFENFQPPKSNSIAQVLQELKPKTVVDIGCSEGYYSFMAEAYGATSVIGIDFSEKVIDTAVQISIDRKSVCKFAHCDLTQLPKPFSKRMYSDFAIGAAIMHHLFKAGMSFERMAQMFASLGENCMIEYIAPFDMHKLNNEKPNHTIDYFKKAFHRYWKKIELLPTIPMGSEKYNEWFKEWLSQNPDATLADMPRVWLKCSERIVHSAPKVSICMGVRNEEKYIRKSIDSLLNQDFTDFELIISDNASTDNTYEICQGFAERDDRIKLYRNEQDLGISNLSKMLSYVEGEYFMLAGGHDLWEPSFINNCVRELENDPNIVLCHTKCAEIDPTDKITKIMPDTIDTRNLPFEERFPKVWLLKTGVPIYGLIRLDAFRKINIERRVLGGDIVMLSELSSFGEIAFIDILLTYQRNHRAPQSSDDSIKRTLKALNPNQYENKFETAWLDLLRTHIEVLSELNISDEKKALLQNSLVECFKVNYGELPESEVKKLADTYLGFFQTYLDKQRDVRIISKAQIALEYINVGLLLYPNLESLRKAFNVCSSISTGVFTKKTRGVKIAGEDKDEKDLTQIDSTSEFATQLNKIINEIRPKKLIETGTYLGTGTTTVVASSLKDCGLNESQFFSIEVRPENHLAARKNLTENGLINYVTLLNGVSMPRAELPTIEEIEQTTVKDIEFDGIFVDHQENERARLYYNETNFDNVDDDLIGKCLITFENKPDFVLLDSGGHMGNLEFNYIIERLEKECIIALDDVNHIKHRKSLMQIQKDSRFELITSSDEKFGFCIAKFTPAKDKKSSIQYSSKIRSKNILFIRTDAVGDNVLASVVLKGIKEKFPKANITVLCDEHVGELYKYSPYIKNIIGINKKKFNSDDEYKGKFLANLKSHKYDIAINSVYSSDQIVDILLFTAGAKETIRIDGNSENHAQNWKWVNDARAKATHVIRTGAGWRSEIDMHRDFLNGLGIDAANLEPEVWLSEEDEEFADKVFSENGFDPAKTIVLFAGAKYDLRIYKGYGNSLSEYCKENSFSIIAVGSSNDEKVNQDNLDDIGSPTLNLSGKTTLRQTAAIIKKCRLAVGAETGNAHIACAVGTPNVIIIGGGHFGRFMPYSGLTSLVTLPLSCYGCNWICKYSRTHCVKDIDPQLVTKAIEDALQSKSENPRIYFNELPNYESLVIFEKMLACHINLDKADLVEVKGNEESTYCKKILYLSEEAIESDNFNNASELLKNILSLEPLNTDALNNQAVIEIVSSNWSNALYLLMKVIEIDPEDEIALGNLQYLNEKLDSINSPQVEANDKSNNSIEGTRFSGEIKLSAIVSVYNAERFMLGCMEDLVSQTLYKRGEMEIVIVETGSQQNEKAIIDQYVKKYPNINYIRIPERETVYQAWNRGVKAAKGKYLTNANADDRHRVNGLEMLVNVLEKYPDKVLAYGDTVVSEVENDTFNNCTAVGLLKFPEFNKKTMLERCYIGPHPVWKKSLHDEFGYFDESLKSAADYEFWLRIAQKYEFIHLSEFVGVYWRNDNSISRSGDIPIWEENAVKAKYEKIYYDQESEKISSYKTDKSKAFFSVVVPVYNHGAYIGFALDSLINQTFSDWEAIVVNDGSTDNTPEVIEEYAKKDSRIRCIHKENGGVSTALNEGIKNAKGEWLCWLSSDDLFEPDKLEVHYKRIQEKPEKKFHISMWSILLEETGLKQAESLWIPIPSNEFRLVHFFYGNYVHGNSVAVHKSVFEKVGVFNPKLRQGQDFDMWLRIVEHFEVEFIQYRTCITRIHPGQDTAGFIEGGKLDSCRSLIQFANTHSFEELFKDLNINKYENALRAIKEIISITLREEAFIHKIGPTTILIDLTRHWITNNASEDVRKKLFKELGILIKSIIVQENAKSLFPFIEKLLDKKKFTFMPHGIVSTAKRNIENLIKIGDHAEINDVERFLVRGFGLKDELLEGEEEYHPVLLGMYENKEFQEVDTRNISKWYVFAHPIYMDRTHHRTTQKCENCGKVFNYNFNVEYSVEATEHKYICPFCKHGYRLDENNFAKYIYGKIEAMPIPPKRDSGTPPRIAYLLKSTNYVGGGNKIAFRHIEWLNTLGCETIVYSFDKKPDWTDVKADYKHIKNYAEIIDTDFDYFIVFSAFDVQHIISRMHPSKVALLCQGYEGYHYGSTHQNIRKDKYILDLLHSFPINNIVVSTHLRDLFRMKFGQEALYIPNSIEHSVFKPSSIPLKQRKPSIVFIGNPFHVLKGSPFLLKTISSIQNSRFRIEDLTLEFVFGFKPENIQNMTKSFMNQTDAKVNIHVRLDSEEVHKLLAESKLLVCSSIYEGFSLPIVEAMATGTPVITTSNMGAESFSVNEYNSFVIDYEDYGELGRRILQVFNNDSEVERNIANAFKTAAEYNQRNSFEHLVRAFSKWTDFKFDEENIKKVAASFNELAGSEEKSEDVLVPQLSIIIPTYNKIKYVEECIESIKSRLNLSYEIVLVDDGSTDDFCELYDDDVTVTVIRNEENLGFPKSVNRGIIESRGKYLLVVNNDILCTDGSIDRMIEIAESDDKIGLVGVISNHAGGPQWDKTAQYKTIPEMHAHAKTIRLKNKGDIYEFPRVTFLFTLIKRSVIELIGGLDERFSPGYFEDDDFCLRAQITGFKSVIAKEVFIHHYGSISFTEIGEENRLKLSDLSKQKFIEKWGGSPEDIWINNKELKIHSIKYTISKNQFAEHFERALQHVEDNEIDLANVEIEDAIRSFEERDRDIYRDLEFATVLNLAGKISFFRSEYEKAKEYFEKELDSNPESSTACQGLGEVYFALEMYEASKTMLEWAVKNDINNLEAIEKLAAVNEILGLSRDDNSLFEQDLPQMILDAESKMESENYEGAKEILLSILETYPKHLDALNDLAVVNIVEGKIPEALEIINNILSIDPQNEIAIGNFRYINEQFNDELTNN